MDTGVNFKREALIMMLFLPLLVVMGLGIAIFAPALLTAAEVDECLDLGGSYDYEECRCDYQFSHPYKEDSSC